MCKGYTCISALQLTVLALVNVELARPPCSTLHAYTCVQPTFMALGFKIAYKVCTHVLHCLY